jgi:Domain of unknown function (DUF4280)
MGQQVCMGATLQCSFGLAPSTLVVLPTYPAPAPTPMATSPALALRPMATNPAQAPMPMATIADSQPVINVPPFGMCTSIANPAVASATAAAQGVLTPMPCLPVPVSPWVPGSPTVLIGGVPALDSNSKLFCAWGGVISITSPGQITVQLP